MPESDRSPMDALVEEMPTKEGAFLAMALTRVAGESAREIPSAEWT